VIAADSNLRSSWIAVCCVVAAALAGCNRDDRQPGTPAADPAGPAAVDARHRGADVAAAPLARSPADAASPPAPPAEDAAAGACRRSRFETTLVADACADGGQAAAKAAMKKFTRAAKKQERSLECKSCHEALSPDYPLKDDGLDHYLRLGGE
jgi:hypothetical protein